MAAHVRRGGMDRTISLRLLALSAGSLAVGGEPTCRDVEREARKHVLSEATLVEFISARRSVGAARIEAYGR